MIIIKNFFACGGLLTRLNMTIILMSALSIAVPIKKFLRLRRASSHVFSSDAGHVSKFFRLRRAIVPCTQGKCPAVLFHLSPGCDCLASSLLWSAYFCNRLTCGKFFVACGTFLVHAGPLSTRVCVSLFDIIKA